MNPYSRVSLSLCVSRRSFFFGRPAPGFRVSKTVFSRSFPSVFLVSGGAKSVYSSAASLAGPRRVPRASICITLIWFACGKVNVWPICAWRCGLDMTSPFSRNFLPEISLVAALMVEAALADGTVAADEAALTANVIARQFDLSEEKARQMTNEAIEQGKERVELHSLLRRLREQSDYEERLGVLEMVWMVVLADGRLDHIEAQLMRRLAGLLFVSDVDSGLAAQKAKSNLGLA